MHCTLAGRAQRSHLADGSRLTGRITSHRRSLYSVFERSGSRFA
jgi:hypothetical protein